MSKAGGRKILFYVQHLLGVGHVFRARRLCQGFARAGFSVEIVFGGKPLPDMKFEADKVHFLPPIRAGAIDYSFNVNDSGEPLTDEYMAKRKEKLLEISGQMQPDLILFEAWPFGRRVVRGEITAMLDGLRKSPRPPLVATSVRDILQEKRKVGRNEETLAYIEKYIDAILVHSDPQLIVLDDTYPLAGRVKDILHYTGFVRAEAASESRQIEAFDVIVSIGGGAFGANLIETALKARSLSALKNASWCLCTGPNLPGDVVARLKKDSGGSVAIRTFLPNLSQHLEKARLSISQVGYNTTMDVLGAGQQGRLRAVLVPSDTAGQTEQLRRAELLHLKGLAINLPESRLDAAALARAIDDAVKMPQKTVDIDFSGVEKSAIFLQNLLNDW